MSDRTRSTVGWRKSSWSDTGNCVEILFTDEHVHVRNSRDDAGAVLIFTRPEWHAFIAGVRLGEFDGPSSIELTFHTRSAISSNVRPARLRSSRRNSAPIRRRNR